MTQVWINQFIRTTFFFLMVTVAFSVSEVYAIPGGSKTPGESKTIEPGQDVEIILDTLNVTLEENRRLKKDLEKKKEEFNTLTAQSNAMRGHLRTLERKSGVVAKQDQAELEKIKKELQAKENQINAGQAAMAALNAKSADLEKKINELELKNKSMETLLDTAVLTQEKDELRRLVADADAASDDALHILSAIEFEKMRMADEMAELHFVLGNAAFEQRKFEQAIVHYSKLLEVRPADPDAHHNLGIIFDYYLADRERAMFHYRNFLRLKSVDDDANQIRERILELQLTKAVIPDEPLKKDFYKETHNAR